MMQRYWVIAPFHADEPELWEKVWRYDLANSVISIGWRELGDFSAMDESQLRASIDNAYPEKKPAAKGILRNMLRDFYHSIAVGDIVVARKGRKRIAAIGTVVQTAYYSHEMNKDAAGADRAYSNHLGIRWHDTPRDFEFDSIVFGMQTIYEVPETRFRALTASTFPSTSSNAVSNDPLLVEEQIKDQTEFVLEKYLEDFIVSNFRAIFGENLAIFSGDEGMLGQQFPTDVGVIDILAQESSSGTFVVIELKKGRESDKVVGQLLRYMGWVSENLCQQGQQVRGLIICRESDRRLSYALKMVPQVALKYYRVDFKLQDHEPAIH